MLDRARLGPRERPLFSIATSGGNVDFQKNYRGVPRVRVGALGPSAAEMGTHFRGGWTGSAILGEGIISPEAPSVRDVSSEEEFMQGQPAERQVEGSMA